MSTDLSPAAQAVLHEAMYRMSAGESIETADWLRLEAAIDEYARWIAAAALEALADQVAPFSTNQRQTTIRHKILLIAAELRGDSHPSDSI